MAAKVVNDDEVRELFEQILWVSVGQEPDVRELLASLQFQLNKQTLKPELSDKEGLAEVKEASKGLKCLLVLDDVVSEYLWQFHRCPDNHIFYFSQPLPHKLVPPVGRPIRASVERD